jgi:hypothetical protein
VIEQKMVRAYFSTPFEGGNNPPDCAANDGQVGIGDPGGVCADCPLSQFGSSEKSEGKACKEGRVLFILKAGNILPDILTLPPTSIKPWRQYLQGLIKTNTALFSVETVFALKKEQNKKGLAYSAVAPKIGARLDADSIAAIRIYRSKMKSLFESVTTNDIMENAS